MNTDLIMNCWRAKFLEKLWVQIDFYICYKSHILTRWRRCYIKSTPIICRTKSPPVIHRWDTQYPATTFDHRLKKQQINVGIKGDPNWNEKVVLTLGTNHVGRYVTPVAATSPLRQILSISYCNSLWTNKIHECGKPRSSFFLYLCRNYYVTPAPIFMFFAVRRRLNSCLSGGAVLLHMQSLYVQLFVLYMLIIFRNHTCTIVWGKNNKLKPNTVFFFFYNDAKKSVDLADQVSSYYSCLRKTVKWYRKIIIQLICGTSS